MRQIAYKTSVAVALSGLDVTAKVLQSLVGREKPAGQHHMKYTPADLRAARYRKAGLSVAVQPPAAGDLPLPPVIVTRLAKSRVGKTCVSVNLAAAIGLMGYRVLFIDADSQGNASSLLGVVARYNDKVQHLGAFLTRDTTDPDEDLPGAIMPIYHDGFLSLLPADIGLADTDESLVGSASSHDCVTRFLRRNKGFFAKNFDVLMFDTASGSAPIAIACTRAATELGRVLAVVEAEGSCLRALERLAAGLDEIKGSMSASGMDVVINRLSPTAIQCRDSIGGLYERFGRNLCDTIIPQCGGFSRAHDSIPMVEAEPGSSESAAIIAIAKTLVVRNGITHPGLQITKWSAQ